MSFTKITNTQLNSRGATTLPNQPKISSTALKQEFDAPAKEIVAPAFNGLIDELEAETAAASLGMVAPEGRGTGTNVQDIVERISLDLAYLEGSVLEPLVEKAHTHDNKALLDTYEQTETDLADAVTKKHTHSNKSLLDSYTQTESNLADAVSKKHEHSNKSVLDKFGESDGKPTYDGSAIGGSPVWGAITGTLSDQIDLDTALGQKSTVSVTQIKSSGEKIATITVDGTGTDIYATQGGAGTGDMTKAVYDDDDTVANAGGIVAFASQNYLDSLTATPSGAGIGFGRIEIGYKKGNNWTYIKPKLNGWDYVYVSTDSAETAIDDADYFPFYDSSAAAQKKSLWSNIKSVLKTYFDTVYAALSHTHTKSDITDFPTLATVATSGSYTDLTNQPSLDEWTTAVTASTSGSDVVAVFDNLSDSYGYKLYCEDTLVGIKSMTKGTGTTTGTIKLTFVLKGATSGTTQCYLRILK